MFSTAYATATAFTRPVIVSVVRFDGTTAASIGSFVVVNDEGWIVTAAHIVDNMMKAAVQKDEHAVYLQGVQAIEQDKGLLPDQKKKRISKLKQQRHPKAIVDYSPWWAADKSVLKDVTILPAADLAIGRLDPFEQPSGYPTFKDPTKSVPCGTSLCRLGFPFHVVQPVYANGGFQLPQGTFPLVFFPNEGILTRFVVVSQDPTDPIAFLETSSPGLPGQSGGPVFDQQGTVWGIQSHTASIPLGFKGQIPGAQGQVEHQFLNVGRATAPATILKLLSDAGIKHAVSAY